MDIERLLKRAAKIADRSDAHVKVAFLLIDKRGRVVASGYNHFSIGRGRLGHPMVHAEAHALNKIRKPSTNLWGLLYRRHGKLITPCESCQKLLTAYGIKTVIHTAGAL